MLPPRSAGTPVVIPRDILKRVGPAADRLGVSHLPDITPEAKLPDFIGPRSILLFYLLKIDHTFLLAEHWRDTRQYVSMEKVITSLTPINDSSERALSLSTSFNGKITRYEESFQNMMLVVAHPTERSMDTRLRLI